MKTILLVDDDQPLRTSFSEALRRSGYHVIEADSGVTGLEMARQHLPDLILSDIDMPRGDGSALLANIRSDPELKSRQFVLMTGRPDLVTSRRGMEEGADDFLVKPFRLQALLSCVKARFSRATVSWRVEDQALAQIRSSIPAHLPHEFFTPLAGIIGLMEILRSDFSRLDSGEVADIHNAVYESALRLNRTLRNYLSILNLPTDSCNGIPPPLPFGEVEASIREGIDDVLRQNNRIEDVTVWMTACSISVKAVDLSHIVAELVDNACKFSRLKTPVTVELTGDGRLTISDRGRGLTADEISRIGAFQQFDRKKYEQQGLGLGLVLVQKLATLCQADFSVKSEPGEGTQAHIAFLSASPA
jgi:two-component system sensor histidine kinase/response regulator